MKSVIAGLMIVGVIGGSIAVAGDAPLAMKGFKMDAQQLARTEEMARLIKELRKIDGPYEQEINAWFKEASDKFTSADEHTPDGSWSVHRRQLLKKLEGIEARKNPQIDVLRRQIDKISLENIRSLRPEQEVPLSEMPIRPALPTKPKPKTN